MLRSIKTMKNLCLATFSAAVVMSFTFTAHAVSIKTVVSEGGIKALLVEDYTVPLIALSYSFKGGTAQDEKGKEGTASLLTNMLDEGAGSIKSQDFQKAIDDIGLKYGFSVGRDNFTGSITTLQSESARAFELLSLMLNKPRFDHEPIERMKAGRFNGLRAKETNPSAIASKALRQSLFANHPYGKPSDGTLETLKAITAEDLDAYRKKVFARDGLVIGVVGAINEAELKAMLDQVFGQLPAQAQLKPVPEITIKTGETKHIEFDTPQTTITMALPGIKRDDPDFYTGYLVNYITGGSSFTSRLYKEVREKRGLAYGAYSGMRLLEYTGYIGVGSATRADRAQLTVDIIKAQMKRMAEEGPTADELEKAKKYLIGSYAISNLDTSSKISSVLVAIQQSNLGIDYIDKRASYLGEVTLQDAKRVAKRLFEQKPTVVTVGKKVAE